MTCENAAIRVTRCGEHVPSELCRVANSSLTSGKRDYWLRKTLRLKFHSERQKKDTLFRLYTCACSTRAVMRSPLNRLTLVCAHYRQSPNLTAHPVVLSGRSQKYRLLQEMNCFWRHNAFLGGKLMHTHLKHSSCHIDQLIFTIDLYTICFTTNSINYTQGKQHT